MQGQKHNSGLDNNNTDERLEAGHNTHPSFVRRIPDKHVFGTSDEVGHRVGGTMKSLPDRNASNFKQNGVTTPGGHGNMNDQAPKHYGNQKGGTTKFGSARRYS